MKEFIVNEYVTLKLEDGKTNIYVKGQFLDCLDREDLSQLIGQSFSVILTDKLPDEDKYYNFFDFQN